jgi:hypothetical protein
MERAPSTAVIFVDKNGVAHDAIAEEPITRTSARINLNYTYKQMQIWEDDVPKQSKGSKGFYWNPR